jgi:ribosomal protein S18 acetylase RimI-like enzyme
MITVIGPRVLQKFRFRPPCSVQGNGRYYLFTGVWVHPSHRGKGLGKKMIMAGMDWIRADDDRLKSETETPVAERRTLLLQVTPNNQQAIGLYSSMGFGFIEGDVDTEDNNLWMGKELES